MRVCSLLPSATEIVGLLGLTEQLVGRSEECDWPPEVGSLPVVTAARVDTSSLSSVEIDRAVRDALADGRSLYRLDGELVERLEPDLVITQDTCEVCAVSGGEVARLCSVDAEVLSLDARSIGGIEECVLELARRLRVAERGQAIVEQMRTRLGAVAERVAGLEPRRVFVAEWLEPPFAAGHWVPEMVSLAGGRDPLGRTGQPSYATTWEVVEAADPELVIVAPCGFDVERAASEAARATFPAPAVAVDANAYYSRPAPRVVDGVEQLAFLFHPNAVQDPGLPWIGLG
jgi:iron complex transport system substrate-binding protein